MPVCARFSLVSIVRPLLCAAVAASAGCVAGDGSADAGGDAGPDDGCAVEAPERWVAPSDWDANAAEALALRGRLDALTVALMREAEQGTAVVEDVSVLQTLFAAGAPSVESVASVRVRAVVASAFEEFVEVVAAGPASLVGATGQWAGGPAGGLYGTSRRGINEGGLEVRQLVDKGLFGGGALYRYAVALTAGQVGPATVDAIAAAWGGNAALDPEAGLTDSASYTEAMGYFDEATAALTAARAYAASDTCVARRDAALVTFFRTWERALFARLVFYMHAASTAVAAAQDDEAYADALHDLAEGVGLALGFLGLDSLDAGPLAGAARVVADADIEAMLEAMGVDVENLGASTTGARLVEQSFSGPIATVEERCARALGASPDEVRSWQKGEEG